MFAQNIKVVPVYAPASSTADGGETARVALKNANWVQFLIMTGAVTTTDTTGTITFTVQTSTGSASSDAGECIPFNYRLSAAVGADNWGDVTAGTTSGLAFTAGTNDNMALLVDVDPAAIPAKDSDASYIFIDFGTPTIVTGFASVAALVHHKYPQAEMPTST
jgi:hypothetical protein